MSSLIRHWYSSCLKGILQFTSLSNMETSRLLVFRSLGFCTTGFSCWWSPIMIRCWTDGGIAATSCPSKISAASSTIITDGFISSESILNNSKWTVGGKALQSFRTIRSERKLHFHHNFNPDNKKSVKNEPNFTLCQCFRFHISKNSHESVEVKAWYVTEMTFAKLPNSRRFLKKSMFGHWVI